MIVMFLGWKLYKKTKFVPLDEIDLVTDRYDENEGVIPEPHGKEKSSFLQFATPGENSLKQAINWLF